MTFWLQGMYCNTTFKIGLKNRKQEWREVDAFSYFRSRNQVILEKRLIWFFFSELRLYYSRIPVTRTPPLIFFKKNFLRPFGHQFGLKIRGAQAPLAPPLDLPLDLTPLFSHFYLDLFSVTYFLTKCDKNPNAICKQLRTSRGSSQKSSRELAEIPGQ